MYGVVGVNLKRIQCGPWTNIQLWLSNHCGTPPPPPMKIVRETIKRIKSSELDISCKTNTFILFFNTELSVWLWLRAMRELAFGRNLVKFLRTSFSYTLTVGGMGRGLKVVGGLDLNPPVCLLSNLKAVQTQWFFKDIIETQVMVDLWD